MIKITAYFLMLLAHIGYLYFPDSDILLILGRLAFPLFAWGIIQGYKYTKNYNKYISRILVIAILSQYPYYLLFHNGYFNVCFTLFCGLLLLKVYDCQLSFVLKLIVAICLFVIVDVMNFEYGMYGLGLILIFHIYGISKKGFALQVVITIIGIYFYKYNIFQLFSILSFLVILLCKNYNFRINKFISYSFYPIHIMLLFIISKLFQ